MESDRAPMADTLCVREALEARGVAPRLAARLADALLPRLEGLGAEEAQALIEGAEVSSRISGRIALEEPAAASTGMENLFGDLAREIQKLDEGVRLIASYAIQIRKQAAGRRDEVLH